MESARLRDVLDFDFLIIQNSILRVEGIGEIDGIGGGAGRLPGVRTTFKLLIGDQ